MISEEKIEKLSFSDAPKIVTKKFRALSLRKFLRKNWQMKLLPGLLPSGFHLYLMKRLAPPLKIRTGMSLLIYRRV